MESTVVKPAATDVWRYIWWLQVWWRINVICVDIRNWSTVISEWFWIVMISMGYILYFEYSLKITNGKNHKIDRGCGASDAADDCDRRRRQT